MTLTGSKADRRMVVSPADLGPTMAALADRLARRAGHRFETHDELPPGVTSNLIDEIAAALWSARGRALVACGSEDPALQRLAILMNELLGAYGATLDLAHPSLQRLGDDTSIGRLVHEIRNGAVDVLITAGVNPVHDLPEGDALAAALARVRVHIAVSERLDETASLARYLCPPPHPLESWGDYQPVLGTLCLRQPTTGPVGDTRSFNSSLAAWAGSPLDARELLLRHWRGQVFDPRQDGASFQAFWDRSLRDGWSSRGGSRIAGRYLDDTIVPSAPLTAGKEPGALVLVGYPSVALMDGRQAYNPWLLELPDPVTKTTWESCASLSPARARALGVSDGDLVQIAPALETESAPESKTGHASIEVPVVVQPGQHDDVVAVPVGFGQSVTRRFAGIGPAWIGAEPEAIGAGLVGANVTPLLGRLPTGNSVAPTLVRVTAIGRSRELARTQERHWLKSDGAGGWATDGAEVLIRHARTDLKLLSIRSAGAEARHTERRVLPAEPEYVEPRWGMVIDLDACTGCSACVVACQAENNTPVVGRDELRRHREMHWIRVDQYYLDGERGATLVHQPMLCHQCGHAPCETVCPVLATTHSSDGLNQQIYSRCIGARYCMNNCPFKVRRFNWFDYRHDNPIENLVLNPDVTVRSRGVAEKCTFCVQRIQEARLAARLSGAEPADGEIVPACAQTCPASAMTFGDLNDPASRVRQRSGSGRAYTLLDALGLQPSIRYLAIIRRDGGAAEQLDHG